MNYKEVKDALYAKGFEIETIQSGGNLDIVGFGSSKIKGEVFVEFDDDELEFEDGIEVDYETSDFLMNIPVKSIDFQINKSISYMSDDVMPTHGEDYENIIYIHNEEVDTYFYQVLDIICDKLSYFTFTDLYYKKLMEFNDKIKRFVPVLEKYEFDMQIVKVGGDNETLFSNVQINFIYEDNLFDNVTFEFISLSWKDYCFISLFGEGIEFDINGSIEEFETEIAKQITQINKFREVLKIKGNPTI